MYIFLSFFRFCFISVKLTAVPGNKDRSRIGRIAPSDLNNEMYGYPSIIKDKSIQ
jgi:hypothetical protein